MLTALTGLAAGSLHVVSGPDHLAALAPLALEDRGRAAWRGAAWGLGHGLGVVLMGGLGLLARQAIDIERLSAWAELSVGFLLIALGAWALRRGLGMTVHVHGHDHSADGEHQHIHVHVGDVPHESPSAHRRHTHAAFGVGMLHGAAGTGHLFGVLPALALSTQDAVIYLAAYLVAAVASMSAFGGLLGLLAKRGDGVVRGMVLASGGAALIVGVAWLANSAMALA